MKEKFIIKVEYKGGNKRVLKIKHEKDYYETYEALKDFNYSKFNIKRIDFYQLINDKEKLEMSIKGC